MSRNKCSFLLVALFSIACIGEPPPTEQHQSALDPVVASGSRIQFRVNTITYASADGASYKLRGNYFFYDTLLSHACELVNLGAVGWKCLPISDLTVDGNYPGAVTPPPSPGYPFYDGIFIFSDSACTRRVAALYDPTGSAVPSQLFIRIQGDPQVYSVGTEVTSLLGRAARFYYNRLGDPTCRYSSPGGGLPVDWRIFEIGSTTTGFMTMNRSEVVEVAP